MKALLRDATPVDIDLQSSTAQVAKTAVGTKGLTAAGMVVKGSTVVGSKVKAYQGWCMCWVQCR